MTAALSSWPEIKTKTNTEKEKARRRRRADLVAILDAIWIATADMSVNELARRADLAHGTIDRLYFGAFVNTCHFETLQKLCDVVGYTPTLMDDGGIDVVVRR